MNKKEKMIEEIDEILELLNTMSVFSKFEDEFIEKYKSHFQIFRTRIIDDEIDINGSKPHTGLFKWLGEYDNIVKNNPQLYDKVYEMEQTFIKP